MPTSQAKILSNQANAARSTGPRTDLGKAISSANSLKHGLTGAGKVQPAEDAAEVDRCRESLRADLKPTTEAGRVLVDRMAIDKVRMDRCSAYEQATLAERVRLARADFVPPEGVDPATAEGLRDEAGHRAMFDPSKEACLARKYEAAAERSFFRSLKEFRQVEGAAKAPFASFHQSPVAPPNVFQKPASAPVNVFGKPAKAAEPAPDLGSFLPAESMASILDSLPAARPSKSTPDRFQAPEKGWEVPFGAASRVPIAIGRAR